MKKLIIFLFILVSFVAQASTSFALWIWTPETNKWINPKNTVKDTPSEQLNYAMEYYTTGDYKLAIREFKKLIKHYPKAIEAPDAQYHIGLSWEKMDKLYEAYKSYQVVIDKYPFSELAGDIVQKQYDIGLRILDGHASRGKIMDSLAGADYDVIDIFKTVIKNAPYGDLAAPAQYKIGLYLQEKKLYQEARDEFEKVINDYPESEWAKAAKFQIAMSDAKRSTDAQYDQKITQSAVEEFEEFLEGNPDADLSKEAKEEILELRNKEAENNFVVAQFYEKQKNYKAAKIYYKAVVDDFADSRWAQKALLKLREMNLKE